MRVAAKTAYTSLRIILIYECNANVVYFDGVQLFTASGQRISKTVGGTTYNYHYLGDQLVEMAWGANRMHFTYDAVGPMSVNFNGTEYFYLKNAQGDVTGLADSTGAKVVAYTYGPWGEAWGVSGTLASTLGDLNPLRYRGYVYDTETGLYYLNSRYYNPVWGRFINADNAISNSGESVNGYNLFAYCFNNPVNMDDPTGNWPKWLEKAAKVIAVAAVVVTAVIVVAVVSAGTGGAALAAAGVAFGTSCGGLVGGIANERKKGSFINGWLGGAANGLLQSGGTALFGPAGTIAGGGVGSGVGTAITESLNNSTKPKQQRKSSKEILNESMKSAIIGTAMSFMTAGIGYGIDYAQSPSGYNAWAGSLRPNVGIAPITPAFGEMMKGFYGSVDDTLVYIFCE